MQATHLRRHPAYFLCRALAAQGFGQVHLCGSADYFDELDEVAGLQFMQHPGQWITREIANLAPRANLMVDLTNTLELDSFSASLSLQRKVPCFLAAWGQTWAAISKGPISKTTITEETEWKAPDSSEHPFELCIPTLVAGLVLQEIMTVAGRVPGRAELEGTAIYNAQKYSNSMREVKKPSKKRVSAEPTVHVVGCGGIGANLMECLSPALHGICLQIFDPDHVEPENLSICPFYAEQDIGKPKAVAVAQKIGSRCKPTVHIQPMVMEYQKRPTDNNHPVARVTCADNYAVRSYANTLSSSHDGVPLLDAGSGTLAAQQRTYIPGYSRCLACRSPSFQVQVRAETQRQSCAMQRTLPGVNMIIGSILAMEVLKLLMPSRLTKPFGTTLTYDCRAPDRFGITDCPVSCCHVLPSRSSKPVLHYLQVSDENENS